MKATITIDMSNEAFADSPHFELAKILHVLSKAIRDYKINERKLRDSNGNVVGEFRIEARMDTR